jgi:hypothetical protein
MDDSTTESDTDSDISVSDGSDISVDGNSDGEFSSDTDSEPECIDIQSSLCTSDSQMSEIDDEDFWSPELHNVEIPVFEEEFGPSHQLSPLDHLYRYFLLMLPLTIFGQIAAETNRYAEQKTESMGHPDPEVKAYFGLWFMLGII